MNDLDEALVHFQKRLDISRKISSASGVTESLISLACIDMRNKNIQEAILKYEEAWETAKKANYWKGEDYALAGLADFYMDVNNYTKVQEFAEKRLELTKKLGNKSGQAHSLIHYLYLE